MRPDTALEPQVQGGSSGQYQKLRTEYLDICAKAEADPVFIVCHNQFESLFSKYFRLDRQEAERVVAAQDAKYSGIVMSLLRPIIQPFERYDIVVKYHCAKKALEDTLE